MSSINGIDKNTSHNLNQATRYKTTQYIPFNRLKYMIKISGYFKILGVGTWSLRIML